MGDVGHAEGRHYEDERCESATNGRRAAGAPRSNATHGKHFHRGVMMNDTWSRVVLYIFR
jgi:hypothetical protein